MLKRAIRIFAVAYLIYLGTSLLVVLPALNILVPRAVEEATGRSLSKELIVFNPFTLALELRGMALHARSGGEPPLLAFDRARANLSTASLWREGVVLDDILLHGLDLRIRQLGEGEFNFSDLLPEESATDDDEPTTLPAFTVGRIDFQAEHLDFTDASRSPEYNTHVDDLAFTVSGLSTVRRAGSPYELAVVTEHGGRLDWRGDLSLATMESAGDIRLTDVDLRPAYRYLAPELAFVVDSALLDVSGSYRAAWGGSISYAVNEGSVALRALQLLPGDTEALPDTSVTLDALRIDGIAVDSEARSVSAADLTIDALAIAGFSAGDTHSLLPMFVPSGDDSQTPDADETAAPDADAQTGDADQAWQMSLQRLATDNTRLRWRSDYTEPALIELLPVQIELRDLAWPAQGPSGMHLALRANERSELTASGELDVGSGKGDMDYRLQGQPLSWFNPVLGQFLRATINAGELNVDGNVTLDGFAPQTVDLSTGVEAFALNIEGREVSALSWTSLAIPDVSIDVPGQAMAVGRVRLEGYRGRLHILPDGRLNAQMAVPASDAPEDGDGARGSDAESDAAGSASDGKPGNWAIRSGGLQLVDARIDFEDEALPIPFRTLIGQLEGDIGTLDSAQPDEPTLIEMAGSVDGYAPVSIDGSVAPFADATALAITVHFRGVDIANLSPYTGTYAGYAIDSGTLNLELAYTLDGDRLQGDNRAVISQMVLGDPVDSERALDLPIRLALALLTDSRGVIDLEVPVTGDIDSPEFSLGRIIGRTLRNVLTKVVTSPFRFLANLVGSEDDLQTMAFTAGADTFGDETRSKLGSLAQALEQRPSLNVLVRGSVDPQEDLPALRKQALEQQLLTEGNLTTDSLRSRNAAWEAALAARYAAVIMPDAAETPADAAADADADTPDQAEVPPEEMEQALLERIDIPPQTLDALVRTRAAAVKRHLVNEGGIAADRVTISGRAGDAQLAGAMLDVSP